MLKGTCQKRFSGFCPLRGYPPPPPPLTENHFAKKTLVEREGYPIPLTENHSAQKSLVQLGGIPPPTP